MKKIWIRLWCALLMITLITEILQPAVAVTDIHQKSGLSINAEQIDENDAADFDFWNGDMEAIEPVGQNYIIQTAAQLAWLSNAINSGKITESGYTITINANLNFMGYEWTPIGTPEHPFRGNLDGKGHTIKGITTNGIKDGDIHYAGLLGVICVDENESCSIYDLILEDSSITCDGSWIDPTRAGTLAGQVSLEDNAAFVVYSCNVINSVINAAQSPIAGGLIGQISLGQNNNIELSDLEIYATIDAHGGLGTGAFSGGVVGEVYDSTTDLCNILIERTKISIDNRCSAGKGYSEAIAGGLIGKTLLGGSIHISECWVDGSLYAQAQEAKVGGLIGSATFKNIVVSDCIVSTDVTSIANTRGTMGGFLGQCNYSGYNTDSCIKNSYVYGNIDAELKAGFINFNQSQTETINIEQCYFDMDQYGLSQEQRVRYLAIWQGNWINTDNIDTSFGVSSEDLPFSHVFLGWDFNNIWTWDMRGYPVLKIFSDDETDTELTTETIVERVKKYTSNYSQEDFDAIINGPGTDIDKANKILQLLNMMKDSMGEIQSFSSLTSNELYASYLMMDRFRSSIGGNLARVALGLNGFIYGEWKDHIIFQDPSYQKYKTLLQNFMHDSQEDMKLFVYKSTAIGFLQDLSAISDIHSQELLNTVSNLKNSKNIDEIQSEISRLSNHYDLPVSAIKNADAVSDILSRVGNISEITDLTAEYINEIISFSSNFKCYKNYIDFLDFIQNNDALPSQLRAAAQDLSGTYIEQLSSCMNDFAIKVQKSMVENGIDTTVNFVLDTKGLNTLSSVFIQVDLGIKIVDFALGMKEFVNAATYVEGYGLLQEEYTKKLLYDKQVFLNDSSEQNAWQFYRDYTLLWNLRLQGEKVFLEFMGEGAGWQGKIRQIMTSWIKYEELEQITQVSRNYLSNSKFSFTDTVTIENESILEYDQSIIVDCPVNIYIYDNEVLQGKIENEEAVKVSDDAMIGLWTNGKQKIVTMPSQLGYEVRLVATDTGTMNYYTSRINADTNETYISKTLNIPLDPSTYYTSGWNGYERLYSSSPGDHSFIEPTEQDIVTSNNKDQEIKIDVNIIGNGTVLGNGPYMKGQYVLLTAIPNNGYKFKGWYENEQLVEALDIFSEPMYTDRVLTAVFSSDIPEETIPVTGVSLNKQMITFTQSGAGYQLEANVTPVDASNQNIIWSSSDPNIATVTDDGFVLAMSSGVCTITAITQDGGYSDTCEVTVDLPDSPNIPVTNVEIDTQKIEFNDIGETYQLIATVLPIDATNRTVVWTSSNPEIVTVDTNGKITAVKNGVATITATTQDGNYTASCEVRVNSDTSNGGAYHPEVDSTSSSSSDRYAINKPSDVENGSIKVSDSKAEKGDTVTITVTPDKGYELDELVVYDEDGDEIDLEDEGDGEYTFEMPEDDVEIEVSFAAIADEAPKADFADVAADAWYADAVQYVFENGMMGGTSETTFSPNLTTTRGMIVTILYRLENEPAVTGTTAFTDVAADQYYADAVAWAAQNGIVAGIDATTFAPNKAITREQMAAILYRYAQFKGYDVSAKTDLSVYTDAAQIGTYAVDAMAWANGAELITGTSTTTLTPAGQATRAQVATILMRFCENVAK